MGTPPQMVEYFIQSSLAYTILNPYDSVYVAAYDGYNATASSTAGVSTYTTTILTDTVLTGGWTPVLWNGYMMTDTACFGAAGPCLEGFNFFQATDSTANPWTNGVLGLAPITDGNPPSVVNELHKAKMISEPIVTFWLNNPFSTIESSITIGALTSGANKGGYTEHKILSNT